MVLQLYQIEKYEYYTRHEYHFQKYHVPSTVYNDYLYYHYMI
jgi:hypothetical protein